MFHKLLFFTLLSSTLLSAMEGSTASRQYPPRVTMQDRTSLESLTNIMPPPQLEMNDYAANGRNSWRHTPEEMETFEELLTSHPLYLQICADPIKHAEEIDTLVSEAKLRICSHIGSGCLALIQPCTPALWSAIFAYRAYKDVNTGENCCINGSLSCFMAIATCGRCSKNANAMRGISKTTQKTCSALVLFNRLRQAQIEEQTDREDKKNK